MSSIKEIPSRPDSTAVDIPSGQGDNAAKEVASTMEKTALTDCTITKSINESIFVKSRDVDDVFGEFPAGPPVSRAEVHRVTPGVPTDLSDTKMIKADVQAPRADRVMSPITPANAQGLLPPEACVFAANFSMMRTDEQLEFSIHHAFDVFGRCLVKVRRDKHRHPFALIQFYNAADAANAIEGSRGLVIDGRRIRTEPAQARRAVIFVKIDGSCPTHEEARNVLGQYGPIEKTHPTTNGDAARLGIPPGLWVQFTYYLDYKDTIKFFNSTSTEYQVHVPPEPTPRVRPGGMESPMLQMFRSPRSPTDQKSIFVGNLPQDANEPELRDLFGQFGVIRALNLIHKPIQGGVGFNVFAFIEYADVMQATYAAEQEFDLRGQRIRVEPKEYSARRLTRLQQQFTAPQAFSPPQYGMPNAFHSSPGAMVPYNPEYQHLYNMSPAAHNYINPREASPYPGNPYNQPRVYATPPSSSRVGRGNQMLHSPDTVPFFSPVQYQGHQYPPTTMGPSHHQDDYNNQHH